MCDKLATTGSDGDWHVGITPVRITGILVSCCFALLLKAWVSVALFNQLTYLLTYLVISTPPLLFPRSVYNNTLHLNESKVNL